MIASHRKLFFRQTTSTDIADFADSPALLFLPLLRVGFRERPLILFFGALPAMAIQPGGDEVSIKVSAMRGFKLNMSHCLTVMHCCLMLVE